MSPMMACRRLDFPEPTSPIMQMNSPFLIVNSMSCRVINFESFFFYSFSLTLSSSATVESFSYFFGAEAFLPAFDLSAFLG